MNLTASITPQDDVTRLGNYLDGQIHNHPEPVRFRISWEVKKRYCHWTYSTDKCEKLVIEKHVKNEKVNRQLS